MDNSYLLLRLLPPIVAVVLCIGGVVLALARWRRHALVSLLAVIGLPLLVLSSLLIYIEPVLVRFPLTIWLVCLTGTIFGVARWRRHPVVSALAVAGLLLLAAIPVISLFVGASTGWPPHVLSAVLTLANILLVAAVFTGKRRTGHQISSRS